MKLKSLALMLIYTMLLVLRGAMISVVKSLSRLIETAEDLYDAINICTRLARRQVKRQLTFNVRTRRKIKEVLLLASKEVEIQNPAN
jgi:adenylyl- and sulfurtransferase ThiI